MIRNPRNRLVVRTPCPPTLARLGHHGVPSARCHGNTMIALDSVAGRNARTLPIVGAAGWMKLMCCCQEKTACRNMSTAADLGWLHSELKVKWVLASFWGASR